MKPKIPRSTVTGEVRVERRRIISAPPNSAKSITGLRPRWSASAPPIVEATMLPTPAAPRKAVAISRGKPRPCDKYRAI
jgi:hypothetical protein